MTADQTVWVGRYLNQAFSCNCVATLVSGHYLSHTTIRRLKLFVSIVFPIADFRSLHSEKGGRLDKPRWGEHDPQARFVRGFGSIHPRTKSGVGFVGENHYADCENLVKYPNQTFISALTTETREVLSYPTYRRFYFDGQMSGRFEFGFRLNEASIDDIIRTARYRGNAVNYDPIKVVRELLTKPVNLHVPDGRNLDTRFLDAANTLRDSYLISSTQSAKMAEFDLSSFGAKYVSVGAPFTFVRAGSDTPIDTAKRHRLLFSGDFEFYGVPSGHQGRNIDTVILNSPEELEYESEQERFARLFYTQLRALSFAHSFYVRQVDDGEIAGVSPLESTISSMLERLKELSSLGGDGRGADLAPAMTKIVENSDISAARMSEEIDKRFKKPFYQRYFPGIFRYFDKKVDIVIESAASTITKQGLSGGL